MKRKLYDRLLEWKKKNGETALLVKGARRVGKSWIVEEFAKNEYESYILIDFNDMEDEVKNLIVSNLPNRDRLFSYLQVTYGKTLHERKSLIIFDEVQECPKARAAIKYLVKDGRYDFIETGSLLSIDKNTQDIVIPSEEESIELNPMDFEEYVWASGNEHLMNYIRECFAAGRAPEQAIHRQAMTLLREYMIVGGMPQAVLEYTTSHDFARTEAKKEEILTLYRADIAKHGGDDRYRIENIWDTIPSQLSRHEKKFRLSDINKNARKRKYTPSFIWLGDARLVNLCFNTTEPNVGLKMNEDRTYVKCYMSDTGLLITHAFSENPQAKADICKKLLLGKLEVNKGMVIENIVAQMFTATGHKLYFFSKYDKSNAEDRMEIDFLLAKSKVTSRHNINLVEVKSTQRYTLSSLRKAKAKYPMYIGDSLVIHSGEYKKEDGITYLPVYMTPFL